ncbi:hypothetical protein MASR2M78_33920 [Treponema sp.]
MKRTVFILVAAALVALGCSSAPSTSKVSEAVKTEVGVAKNAAIDAVPLKLTILHVNDTHGKLESAYTEFKVDIDSNLKAKRTFIELGGFSRLWAAVDVLRAENPNTLFVHAGDIFQGTLYFTQFAGKADLDFFNSMGLDAMVLGNHEFDKGPAILADFAEAAKFPVLACNLDLSAEPSLSSLIKPYVIKNIGGSRVALVGIANEDTPYISSPGPNVKFLDPAVSLAKVVKELEGQGLNKIIVISHRGYELDKAMAAKVAGIDAIIGGHSHTLLGPLASVGLKPLGDYPTVIKNGNDTVLVATSWQWANQLGDLDIEFDSAGKIVAFKGMPKLLAGMEKMRVYDLPGADGKMKRVEFTRGANSTVSVKEYDGKAYAAEPPASAKASYFAVLSSLSAQFASDSRFIFVKDKPEGVAKLASYSASIKELQKKVASKAADELKRANNQGPGPIIADSMIWKTGADVAVMNPGGVRVDMVAGDISVAQVYELQPFGNTLMTIDMSGAELVQVIEDMCDFSVNTYNMTAETAYVYLAGARMNLMVNAAKGSRVKGLEIKAKDGSWKAVDAVATYKVVVNNFMGTGGDKNFTLEKMSGSRKYDTGFIDSEAMLEYVMGKTLMNASDARVKNVL